MIDYPIEYLSALAYNEQGKRVREERQVLAGWDVASRRKNGSFAILLCIRLKTEQFFSEDSLILPELPYPVE